MKKRQEQIILLKNYKKRLLWYKYNKQLSNEVEQKIPQFKRKKSKQKVLTLFK